MTRDPRTRFSDRVAHYVRYRPSYPAGLADALTDRGMLLPGDRVADVGSGTGLLSRLFLERGHHVIGIEPNAAMRRAGDEILREFPDFESVEGSAEATRLERHSVDLLVAGQAFHWFDRQRARDEFLRVLRPGGPLALVFNVRRTEDEFHAAYEALIDRHAIDYRAVRHENLGAEAFAAFFGHPDWEERCLPNAQVLDRDGLLGRLLSCSYIPGAGEPGHAEMVGDLDRLFDAHQDADRVTLRYRTQLLLGRLR